MITMHLRTQGENVFGAPTLCGASLTRDCASWTVEAFALYPKPFADAKKANEQGTHVYCLGCFPGKEYADDARWCADKFLEIICNRIREMRAASK